MKISIIIPCYNERTTITQLLRKVQNSGFSNLEVIVIDDASEDGTTELLCGPLAGDINCLILHESNRGKGTALRSGLNVATGDIIVIQDADLEYDPCDYQKMLDPIINDEADVVYGSRFANPTNTFPILSICFNKSISFITRKISGWPVTDVCTGYKAIKREPLKRIDITESGFAVDVELTVKLAADKNIRYHEVAINYHPRKIVDGKKIRWWHGFSLLRAVIIS